MSSFSTNNDKIANRSLNPNLSTEIDPASSSDPKQIVPNKSKNTKRKSTKKKSLGQEIILLPKRKKNIEKNVGLITSTPPKKKVAPRRVKKYIKPTRQEKKEKKFWETVEKMHLKTCKTIVIGIGYDLFQCSIARISPNYVHLFLKGRYYSTVKDADRYSLKNLKIMMEQGVYLTRLFAERAFNKKRSIQKNKYIK